MGYKGTLRDGTMQLNSAVYYYDYKNVETFGTGPSAFNPANTSTSVFSVPSAQIIGWDTDLDWLITDNLTLGANFSYTHSEYTDNFVVNDPNDPNRPPSLFNPLNIPIDLNGKQMLQVPEMKGGIYAQYTLQMADRGHDHVPRQLELDRSGVLLGVRVQGRRCAVVPADRPARHLDLAEHRMDRGGVRRQRLQRDRHSSGRPLRLDRRRRTSAVRARTRFRNSWEFRSTSSSVLLK